jgi:hypothetical protein
MKYIEKIKKLLALSKSANVHEAALAMEHAQRLMEEHNLTIQDVRASDVKTHEGPMAKAKVPAKHVQALAGMVASSLGCHLFMTATEVSWGKWESRVCFIGIESAAELAGYAFDVLRRQLDRDRREHIAGMKRCGRETKVRRADAFCTAWVWQVSSKVRRLALPPEQEAAIVAFTEKEHPNLGKGRTRKSKGFKGSDFNSAVAGAKKGKDASLNAGIAANVRRQLK